MAGSSGDESLPHAAGLDAVFKAYDVRGLVPEQFDAALARTIGAAFVEVLGIRGEAGGPGAVVVGQDMRPSGDDLVAAFAEGVCSQGCDVIRIGLASTDGLYFASGDLGLPGAMFTASHNPAQYNGIKLCRAGAAPVGLETGLREMRDLVESGVPSYAGPAGTVTRSDTMPAYAGFLRSLVDLSSSRALSVVIDAGNGMAGLTAPPRDSRHYRCTSPPSTSNSTGPSRITRPIPSSQPTCATCRARSSPKGQTSDLHSTAMPIAASSSTNAELRSTPRPSRR